MAKFLIILTFFHLFLGCNSQQADLRRIESPNTPFMHQMGNISAPSSLPGEDTCNSIAYYPRNEGFVCAGSTNGDLFGLNVDRSLNSRDGILILFDRKRKIVWAKQEGSDSPTAEVFRAVKVDERGSIYTCGRWNGSFSLRKYSGDGVLIWDHEYFPGNCYDILLSQGRVYISGTDTTSNPSSAYIAEIDPIDGNLLNPGKKKTAFQTDRTFSCSKLSSTPAGEIFCVGGTNSQVKSGQDSPGFYTQDHDNNPSTPDVTYYYNDAFIWAFDANLVSELVFEVVGTPNHHEAFNGITISNENQVFVGGYYFGSAISGTGDDDLFPAEFNRTFQNMLIYRYDFDGNSLVNQIQFHSSHDQPIVISDLNLHPNGRLVVTGSTRVLDWEEGPGELNIYDAYAAYFNPETLGFIKARRFGESSRGRYDNRNHQSVSSSIIDPHGNILMGGTTQGSTNEVLMGGSDIMIWRMGPNLEF